MKPSQRAAHYDELNRVIAALHRVDYAAVGLGDYGRTGNYIERQVGALVEAIPGGRRRAHRRDGPPDRMAAVAHSRTATRRASSTATTASTTSSSIRPSRASSRCSTGSCPHWAIRSPISRTRSWRGGCRRRNFAASRARTSRRSAFPREADYVAAYCRRTGRTGIPHWEFYLIFNMFRIAAILHGVLRARIQGNAASADAIAMGSRARRWPSRVEHGATHRVSKYWRQPRGFRRFAEGRSTCRRGSRASWGRRLSGGIGVRGGGAGESPPATRGYRRRSWSR